MSIFNLSLVNKGLKPIYVESFQDSYSWKIDAMHALSSNQVSYFQKHPLYQVNYLQRVSFIAAAVIGLLTVAILSLTFFTSFNMTWSHTFWIVILIPIILLTGGLLVLYCLSQKVDVFADVAIKPFGQRIWVPMPIWRQMENKSLNKHYFSYLDLSTLDEQQSGVALAYLFPKNSYIRGSICLLSICAIPWVVLFRMAYNIIRFLVIPFYILFRMICQCLEKQVNLNEDETFIYTDIIRESARSLCDCLSAPFYGAAYMISLFYSLLDPLAGRVAIAALERDWNKDVILSKSIWVFVLQKFFKLEGGGSRTGLGQHGFYLMGCLQPHSVLLFEHGEITSVKKVI